MPRSKRLYFDYAASTPVAPEVEVAMKPYFGAKFGNAGSLHSFGQEAMAALDESREKTANALNVGFRNIIFTGSATEANNLALRGAVKKFKKDFPGIKKPEIIVSAIEHESVLETARKLEKEGVEAVYLPVSKKGIVDLKKLKKALNERTVLVSVMYANNEIGTIQPLFEINKIINDFKKRKFEIGNSKLETNPNFLISHFFNYPLFHTDAVQAFQFLKCDAEKLGVDLMTLSGHKIYGPKGIGALYVRRSKFEVRNGKNIRTTRTPNLEPVITGGGQEFGFRSGTENIPLVAGFAKAVSLAAERRSGEAERIGALRDYFWKGMKKICPAAERNGDASKILPNFLNVYMPDFDAADLLVRLDLAGIAVSAGSACSARSAEPSYVINALGLGGKRAGRSIRITLGKPTSKRDIDIALKIINDVINA